MEKKEKRKIEDLLDKLSIPVSNLGYEYLVTAINDKRLNENAVIEDIYHNIAEKHHTTRDRVERAIRHSYYKKEKTIQEYFNVSYKITNKKLLALLIREVGRI